MELSRSPPNCSKDFWNYCTCLYLLIGQLRNCVLKDIFENAVFCTNIHLDVIDLVHHGMVKNTKFDYLENETTFLRNKKISNLCLRWHILRSYRFIVEVTFNDKDNRTTFQTSHMMSFQCLYFKTFLEFPLLTELINASWELFNISYGSFRFKKNYPE